MYRIQKALRILSVVFLLIAVASFYVAWNAEAANDRQFTENDKMGNTYDFTHHYDSKQVYWNITAYSGRPVNDGTIYNLAQDNIITGQGDNNIVTVYVQTDGTLHARILPATWVFGGCAYKDIPLDRDIESIAANQVQIFWMHKFGARVAWLDKNGKAKYAIFELWHCKIEEGDLEDYEGNDAPVFNQQGGQISGKSVVLVLDSSGSMSGDKISKAKSQIKSRVKKLSKDDEVALFIFKGCGDVPLIQGFTQDHNLVIQGLDEAKADGGSSPVAESIQEGMEYLIQSRRGTSGELSIYTDGGENCSGDPVAAASQVKVSTFPIDFLIVGYNVSDADKKQLKEITEAAGGEFDKEKVWESRVQKAKANQAQKQAATVSLTALLAAISSYVTGGGLNLPQMYSSVFGGQGFFVSMFQGGSGSAAGAASAAASPGLPPVPTPSAPLRKTKAPSTPKLTKPKAKKLKKQETVRRKGPSFCTRCGSPLASGNQFCTRCGTKLS